MLFFINSQQTSANPLSSFYPAATFAIFFFGFAGCISRKTLDVPDKKRRPNWVSAIEEKIYWRKDTLKKRYIEENIEFTAGSGIVSGSVLEKEIDEIKLKFESIVKQIFFAKNPR